MPTTTKRAPAKKRPEPVPKAVHRDLHLATPPVEGADVRALQSTINERYDHFKIDRAIEVDGVLGSQTLHAAEEVGVAVGVVGGDRRAFRRRTITESAQKLIRGRKATLAERAAAKARAPFRRRLRRRYAKDAGEIAVQKAMKLVGVHEEPSGSNWGPMVSRFITFCGYSGPVYWCGCFACWVVVKLGGAAIPNRIRLGYAPYITADALAHTNGLTALPIAKGRAGCLGSLWGGEHVVTLAEDVEPGATTVKTIEGNTSSSTGSQSNGGEVAVHERALSDFDHGICALPAWA